MMIEKELPQKVRQTIKATKALLTVSFNLKKSAAVNLVPRGASITGAHCIDNMMIPLPNRYTQQPGKSPVADCISTIPSVTLLGMSKMRWPAISASIVPLPRIHPI
jgi:hypothetical protein